MRSLLASLLLVPLISCGDSSSSGKSGGKNSGGSGGAADDESGGEDEPLPLPDFDALADEYNEWCLAADEAQCACCIEGLGEDGWCPLACSESACDMGGEFLAYYFTETSDPAELACMLARASAWAFVFECQVDIYNSMDCSTWERGSTALDVYNECAVLSQEAQAAACDE